MPRKIHHINFVVFSLDAAIPTYEALLGIPVTHREDLPARGVRTARFLVGETWIVLVEPVEPDSVAGRHLAEHGEGFFLMSLEVESLAQSVESLGSGMFDGSVRPGLDNWQVIDLRRDRTFGAQLQLVTEYREDVP